MRIEWKTFIRPRRRLKRTFPTGTVFFTGRQGAGKSLSATHYLHRLKQQYPDMYIYSNIFLTIADKVIKSEEVADYILDQKEDKPIAFFIDEIQTVLFNSKKSVSFETFKAICQQRKAQKTIVGTMQEFLDLDMRYRRQVQSVVQCSSVLGVLQLERWVDPETLIFDQTKNKYVGKITDFRIWKRHNDAYDLYDTFEIVDASMNIDKNKETLHMRGSAPM